LPHYVDFTLAYSHNQWTQRLDLSQIDYYRSMTMIEKLERMSY